MAKFKKIVSDDKEHIADLERIAGTFKQPETPAAVVKGKKKKEEVKEPMFELSVFTTFC